MQRRDTVHCLQAASCRHHVEAVAAVTRNMQVVLGVPVLHHDDEAGPAVGQVVAGHPLSALRTEKRQAEDAAGGGAPTICDNVWTR